MMACLIHRGPDDHGVHAKDGINLGHRRLSIINLSAAGRQPMSDPSGQVWVATNGEIYNFHALREALRGRYPFRTAGDTEAILAAYLVFGPDRFLDHLDGMFAFALWDARDASLILARDRMGIKPLYWARIPSGVAFASELRALIRHPDVPARLDLSRLPDYLMFRSVHAPSTALAGVSKLRPGHALTIRGGALTERRYWAPAYEPRLTEPRQALEAVRASVEAAVERHLVADVPVALMLSGGLDSGILAVCASRSASRLQCITVAFEGEPDNEDREAAWLARELGIPHRRVGIAPADISLLPQIVMQNDEPVAGPSSIAYWLALREARQHAKVILFGHGADELFGGYEQWKALRAARALHRLPPARQAARGLARLLCAAFPSDAAFRRLAAFLDAGDAQKAYLLLISVTAPAELPGLLRNGLGAPDGYRSSELADAFALEREPDAAMLRLEQGGWLADDLLHRVDRMTMVHSLEGRVPFLDRAVVECANAIPSALKLRRGTEKYILREAFRAALPARLARRRKQRFNTPIHRFFGPAYDRLLRRLFSLDHPLLREVFDRQRLLALLRDRRVANPVVLTGDIHSFWAADLKVDFGDPGAAAVASEYVCTSITSQGAPHDMFAAMLPDNPHIKFMDARVHGYALCTVGPQRWTTDFRAVESVRSRQSGIRTLASFVTESGRPGVLPA